MASCCGQLESAAGGRIQQVTETNAWCVSRRHGPLIQTHFARLINLELLQKYGANAWRVHNYMLEAHLKRIQAANEDIKNKILQINRERKMDQVEPFG